MKDFIKKHKFFVRASRAYVATGPYGLYKRTLFSEYYGETYTLGQALYWPIAYIKFMWFSRNDTF